MSSALLPEAPPTQKQIDVPTEEGLHSTLLRALIWASVGAVIAYPLCSWWGAVAAASSSGLAVGLSRLSLLSRMRSGWIVAAAIVVAGCSFWSEHVIGSSVLMSRTLGPGRVLTLIEVVTFGGMLFGGVLALRTLSRYWAPLVFLEAAAIVAGVAFSFRSHRQFPFSQPQALSDWAFLQGRDPRHIIMTIGLATLVALGLLMLPRQGIRRTAIAAAILLLFSWLIFPWLIGPAVNALAAIERVESTARIEDFPKESKPLFNPPPEARPRPAPPPNAAFELPLVRISDAEVIEGDAGDSVLAYEVSLSTTTNRPVTVNLRTTGGSATENTDYEPQNGQLTIPPGQTNAAVSINVTGDTDAEIDETVFVALSTPVNALIERDRGRGVIVNDDDVPMVPLLSVADVSIKEGDSGETAAQMVLRLSAPVPEEVSVTVSRVEGSSSDDDCTVPFRTVKFRPGETEVPIPIRVRGDVEIEEDETFGLKLTDVSDNVLLERASATGTIVNDDFPPPPIVLSISDGRIEEGNLGLRTMAFNVILSRSPEESVEVKFATVGDTATPDEDFVPRTGTFTFAKGHSGALLTFEIHGDKLFEEDEQFFVRLEKPGGVELRRPHGVGTIVNDDIPPELSILDAEIKEGDDGSTRLEFEVELSEPPHIPVAVEFTAIPQTAQARIDYRQTNGRLHFPAGRQKRTATLRINGDPNVEDDETLIVRLHDPKNAVLKRAEAIGTILNDDEYPKISITDNSIEEGNSGLTPLELAVTLSKPWHQIVRVDYETLRYDEPLENPAQAEDVATSPQSGQFPPKPTDETAATTDTESQEQNELDVTHSAADRLTRLLTAIPNRDHRPRSGTLLFFPRQTKKSLAVQIIGDEAAELDEQFVIRLSNPLHATLDRERASGTIINDDPLPKVSISDAKGKEGDGGSSVVVFVVTLSKPAASPVEIEYETEEGTAKAGVDFIPTRGTVTIPTGATQAQIPVEIPGDAEVEPPESFKMKFDPPDNAELEQNEATGTIDDEDDQDDEDDEEDEDDPEITIGDVSLDEGSAGTTAFVFPVTLSHSVSKEVEVTYTTVAGTATEGEDYELAEGLLTIPPGTTEGNITVNVLTDEEVEPDESFEVILSEPQHATLEDETGAGSILNDDKPSLSIDDVEIDEGNEDTTEARFTITLSEAVEDEVVVSYTAMGDSAAAEQDFEPIEERLTIPAGQTTASVIVTVISDTEAEPEEQFQVILSDPEQAKLDKERGIGTILNDDDPVISIEDVEAEEGTLEATPFEFRVTLSSVMSKDVEVDYTTFADTAAETEDFQATTGTLTIPAGQSEARISVEIVADEVIEKDDAFKVRLTKPKNAIIADDGDTATGTILNDDKPKLSIDDVETEETNETVEVAFTATISEAIEEDVSFRYKTVPDTAEPDTDYLPLDEEITIPAGETTATINVSVVGDEIAELQEEYEIVLSDPVRAELDKETGIGTITNDDDPSITIDDFEAEEGNAETTPFDFTVTLSSATSKDVEVDYTAIAGTAESGGDFVLAEGTLSIPSETTRATITVEVVGDDVIEKDESFEVTLSSPHNATIEDDSATGTILNDDKPTLSVDDAAISENPESDTPSLVMIHLSEAIEEDVSFTCTAHGGSAESSTDFQAFEGYVATIPAGKTAFALKLQIVDDEIVELDETFEVRLSDPVKANIEQGISVVTINDDDFPEATIEDAQVEEGDSGTTPIAFNVKLSAPTSGEVTFNYFIDSRTALIRDDVMPVGGTLRIPAGETEGAITVEVIGDTQVEEDETFEAFINTPVRATVVRRLATGTIINDDFFPDVSVADVEINEGQAGTTAARFVITLSEASRNEITLDYETVDSSAVADDDFRPASATLKIPPGQTEAAIVAEVVGDNIVEEDETFELHLTNIVNAALVRDRATGTIVNDDIEPPLPSTSIQDAQAKEGDEGTTEIEFVAQLSEPAREDVSVHYATGGGTAHPDDDYDRAEGDVTIPAGSSQATITVAIRGDTEPEQDETFEVHLSSPDNSNLARYKAVGTITNDDGDSPDESSGEDEFNWEANAGPPSEPVQLITMDDDYNPVENGFYLRTFAYSRLEGARLRRDHARDADIFWELPQGAFQVSSQPPSPVLRDFAYQAYLIGKQATLPGILQTVSASPLTNPMPGEFTGAFSVTSQVLTAGYQDGEKVDAYKRISQLAVGNSSWDEQTRSHYLSLPDDRRYQDLAREISRGLSSTQRRSPFARMVAVKEWMSENLTFDYNPAHKEAEDPTASFLFGDRRGYCIHLAHAMTFLLRAQDIPARLAAGYRVGSERRGQRRGFLVYSSDSHAWAEMYVEGIGWVAVEAATKGRIPPPDPEPDPREVDYYLSLLSDVPPEVFATSSGGWRRTATVGGTAGFSLGLILLYAIKFIRLLLPFVMETAALYRTGYRSVLDRLAQVGIRRNYAETWDEFAERIREFSPDFVELTKLHLQATYSDTEVDRTQWKQLHKQVIQQIRSHVPWTKRWLGWLNPLSWLGVG